MIIGLSGKAQSGKDTVGAMIHVLYREYDWEIKKFAGKLKQIVSLLTGVPVGYLENDRVKQSHAPDDWTKEDGSIYTYRELLRVVGTNALREVVHKNVWVNALFADYDKTGILKPNWIITDVRFPNEVDIIRKKDPNSLMIRVNRKSIKDPGNHPTETALDNYDGFDYVIDNDGTVNELERKVKNILDRKLQNSTFII